MKLREVITRVQEAVKDIPNIEKGGCGVFAGILAEGLEQKGYKVKIRVADYIYGDEGKRNLIHQARSDGASRVSDWESVGLGFGHVFLEGQEKGKTIRFDNNETGHGIPTYPTLTQYRGELYLDELIDITLNEENVSPYDWNSMFNREYIPTIQEKVKEVLDTIPDKH